MKRPFTILALILCITGFLLCPLPSFADEEGASWIADTSWFNYLEPKSEYTISTESQLRGLASLVNEEQYLWKPNRNESFEGVTFILTRDLDLTGSWTPIGVDEQITFSGTFDGQGHTISGIRVESEDPYSGFFGHLSGTVKNLHLEGTVSASADYCGGVAGYLGADAVIRNCQTDVQVAGRNEVGGIAGYVKSGTVYGCINYGEVIGASMTGGVAGECRGGKIGKCGNRGLIVSNGAGSFNNGTGGIAGRSVSASALNMCYNTGDIISSNEATGGIAGYTNSAGSSIRNSYTTGTIRIDKPQVNTGSAFEPGSYGDAAVPSQTGSGLPVFAGGIAGYVGTQNVVIENCYNAGQISGADYAGGIIGKCINDSYSETPSRFRNNYFGKGGYDSAIAADSSNRHIRIRGAATEIYDSAFGNLSAELGEAFMDDRTGDYGSSGYPVLTWQPKISTEENLAALRQIDPAILKRLHDAKLAEDAEESRQGTMVLKFFNSDLDRANPKQLEELKKTTQKDNKEKGS